MFQKEFAARLVARPGDDAWSRLSANVQLYAEVNVAMDVGRNNFRPPPKVESTVVRLVPRDPPPPVEFGEFDGLARIVFGRRNKTVHANFMAKGVMDMLESNWKTWASVNNVVRRLSSVIQAGATLDTDAGMQTVEGNVNFKKKVEEVLEESGFSQSRAAKMDINDLLKSSILPSV